MITTKMIENDDYSTNDVSDLMMRLQIAKAALDSIVKILFAAGIDDSSARAAYRMAVNTLGRLDKDHDCSVDPSKDGCYRCECDLISSYYPKDEDYLTKNTTTKE